MRNGAALIAAALLVLLASGRDALAHALAQRYDLPLPLGYFLAAAGAAVVVSFVILALFWGGNSNRTGPTDHTILRGTMTTRTRKPLHISMAIAADMTRDIVNE